MAATVVCNKANHKLIAWSRKESGYTVSAAAKWLKLSDEEYKRVETGEVHPTLTQLRQLANHYKRPIAVFFMPAEPKAIKKPKDFRAHEGEDSPKLMKSIRRARFVQDGLSELAPAAPVVLWSMKHTLANNADAARKWLGIDDHAQTKNRDVAAFYKQLIKLFDEKSVTVLQHSFPQTEAKAYSFAEAPRVVVVSTNDPYMGSRIFSLLHELCHISRGQSGLCIPNDSHNSYANERECDKFAAEFLMPMRLVRPLIKDKQKEELLTDDVLRATAETLKVSMYALLIRLSEMGAIQYTDVAAKVRNWKKIPRKKGGAAAVTRSQRAVKENGVHLTSVVLSAYNSNQITATDASYYLNINQSYLSEVGEKVAAA